MFYNVSRRIIVVAVCVYVGKSNQIKYNLFAMIYQPKPIKIRKKTNHRINELI